MGLSHIELREARQAAQIFEQCLKEFPRSENTPLFLLSLGQSYTLGGPKEKAKARKPLEILIQQYPNSDAAARATVLLGALR
jgi:TolA-binding protein